MAYRKSVKYPKCPKCHTTKAVNYIGQIQRGMRHFCCATCSQMFFTWGTKIKKPRPLRDIKGKMFKYSDELGMDGS